MSNDDQPNDEAYEFENVAEVQINKINGLNVKKRNPADIEIKRDSVGDPIKSNPSLVNSGFTYTQSQFPPKNLSSFPSGVEYMSKNKFRISTDGSQIPKNVSIGGQPPFERVQEEDEIITKDHSMIDRIAKDSKSSNLSMMDR